MGSIIKEKPKRPYGPGREQGTELPLLRKKKSKETKREVSQGKGKPAKGFPGLLPGVEGMWKKHSTGVLFIFEPGTSIIHHGHACPKSGIRLH